MGDADIVNTILQYVPQINFTTTAVANQGISVFETNIRYLGGLLSGTCSMGEPSFRVKDCSALTVWLIDDST
jgi:hypothetical protein